MSDLMQTATRQEPALASLPLADGEIDTERMAARPRVHSRVPYFLVFGLVALAAAFFAWWMRSAPPPPPTSVAQPVPAATPVSPVDAPPAIRYPIDSAGAAGNAPAATADAPAGDASLLAGLMAISGGAGIDRLIFTDDVVHRFVATIDNLPRTSVASKVMSVRPPEGAFAVDTDDGRMSISGANATRYAPYLKTLQALDTAPLVALYVRNYPAFQQAYRDLGYPNGYFNDRLVDVIDHLLAAPEVQSPVTVLQPRVLYEYANPDLEARSAGQKALLRLGPEGERAAKAKLREIRRALTAVPAR
ncbi:MAG: DUF3014 domain-containing protein [Casimicrobiaceae bacterium]